METSEAMVDICDRGTQAVKKKYKAAPSAMMEFPMSVISPITTQGRQRFSSFSAISQPQSVANSAFES
jgi:hypothetical protein